MTASSLVSFACPGCGRQQEALPSAEPMHQCPKKNNRVVAFRRQPTNPQETTAMAPKTTTNQISKGNAPRQAAKRAGKVAESKQKLDDLVARQDEVEDAIDKALTGDATPAEALADATDAAVEEAIAKAATKRAPSMASKEGTQVDSFTGETLPVTAFPTLAPDKDGIVHRGTVARKNLPAFRAAEAKKKAAAKPAKAAPRKAAAQARKAS